MNSPRKLMTWKTSGVEISVDFPGNHTPPCTCNSHQSNIAYMQYHFQKRCSWLLHIVFRSSYPCVIQLLGSFPEYHLMLDSLQVQGYVTEQFSKLAKNLATNKKHFYHKNSIVYMDIWDKYCKWFENSPFWKINITSCKMANDILGGIINPKYQAETMLVFVYPTRNIPQL